MGWDLLEECIQSRVGDSLAPPGTCHTHTTDTLCAFLVLLCARLLSALRSCGASFVAYHLRAMLMRHATQTSALCVCVYITETEDSTAEHAIRATVPEYQHPDTCATQNENAYTLGKNVDQNKGQDFHTEEGFDCLQRCDTHQNIHTRPCVEFKTGIQNKTKQNERPWFLVLA